MLGYNKLLLVPNFYWYNEYYCVSVRERQVFYILLRSLTE